MCLTDDRQPEPEAVRPHLFIGAGREQLSGVDYAQRHQGVCLVLDTSELMTVLREAPPVNGRYTASGGICDTFDEPILIDFSGTFADEVALDAALESFLDGRYAISGLHMIKNRDWSYEAEVRLVTVDVHVGRAELDTPLYLDLGQALAGVIFGDATGPRNW